MIDQKKTNNGLPNTSEKQTDTFEQGPNDFSRPLDDMSHEGPPGNNKPEMQSEWGASEFERRVQLNKNYENQLIVILKQKTEQLERSNQDLETFAYTISHDLQEPLRTVSNLTELLKTRIRGRLDQDEDQFFEQIISNTNRLSKMIQDLLKYSRLQTEGNKFEPVDLKKVVLIAIANLGAVCKDTQTIVTWDPLPIVSGDENQLISLFQNLIGNSIKFRKDAEPPKIHIGVDLSSEKKWHLFVQDNGIGIDPKYFDKLFIIFKRFHARDKYPGTGIGLATCKKIVERHGGRIWVESEPSKGATFHFSLPRTDN